MTSQIKYKNWNNFESRFNFNLCFFLKVIFLGVSLNKIKFYKIRSRNWSAVSLEASRKFPEKLPLDGKSPTDHPKAKF